MKKKFYCALSIIGFIILFGECSVKICNKGINYSLWFRLLGKVFVWWGCMLMLPAGVSLLFYEKILEFNYILGNIYNILILLYVYVIGIVITSKLYDWKNSNIAD